MSKSTLNKILYGLFAVLLLLMGFMGGFLTNEYMDGVVVRNPITPAVAAEAGEMDLFWEAWRLVEQDYIGGLPDERQRTYAAIRGVLAALDDPYTVFLEPVVSAEEQISLRGNFGGIGAYVQRNEAGDVVLTLIPGNPAEEAGILDNDVLLAVDDTPITAEMSVEEVVEMVRGEVGTDVILTVRHEGEDEPVEIAVTRGNILLPSVITRLLPEDETVGYVQLTRFSGESAGEMETAVADLLDQGAEKIVLDLRNNGGGLLDAAIEIADQFVAEGDLMFQESANQGDRTYTADEDTVLPAEVPLVVLVNGGTASASEILAGALQDSGRATLVGTVTFGKGSVQMVHELSDGSSIHVTSSRWYTPNRSQIDQQGLTPDRVIDPIDDADGRDEQLDAAVETFE